MCLVKREYFTFCGETDDCCIEDTPLKICDRHKTCKEEYVERWVNDYCRAHPYHAGDELDSDEVDHEDQDENGDEPADRMERDRPRPVPVPAATGVNAAGSQGPRQPHRNDDVHTATEPNYFDDAAPSVPAVPGQGVDINTMGIPPFFDAHTFSLPIRTEGTAQPSFAVPPFTDINGVTYPQDLHMFEQPLFGPGFQPSDQDTLGGEFGFPYMSVEATSNGYNAADTEGTDVEIEDFPALLDIRFDAGALQEFNGIVNPLRDEMTAPMAAQDCEVEGAVHDIQSETASATPEIPVTVDDRVHCSDSPDSDNDNDNDTLRAPVQAPAPTRTPSITSTAPLDITTPSPYTVVSARPSPTSTPTPGRDTDEAGLAGEEETDDESKRPRKRRRKGGRLSVRKYAWRKKGRDVDGDGV